MTQHGPYAQLVTALKQGDIDRRTFLARASALGVGLSAALFTANSAFAGSGKNGFALYQGADGTPSASPATGATGPSPSAIGTEGQTRGQDGELKIILWQAPTLLSPHVATGTKDSLAGSLVLEPLMGYLPDGTIYPRLVTEVPAVENGGVSEDLKTVKLNLIPGVTWSDGEPFTSTDVKFTWQWITNTTRATNLSVNQAVWDVIDNIDDSDPNVAVVTFKQPSAAWFVPFSGTNVGYVYPAHVFNNDPENGNDAFLQNPIGTGPYVVTAFAPNDSVQYKANEKYREANKPAFATVSIKGGGDAASAARAVLETGEYDYAWNLQVEPDIINAMVQSSTTASLVADPGTSVERLIMNFSDPNKEVNGQRSELNTPNPVIGDDAIRKALNMAVPRDIIAHKFYGELIPPTPNILAGEGYAFTSPNTSWVFDVDAAGKVLDEAGWAMDGDVRKKDGVEASVTYATTINQVRQKTQAVVKQAFEKLGVKVQLLQIDAGIFFDSSAGNDQNTGHMYWDIAMYTSNATSPIPISFMAPYYAGPDNVNIAQKSNGWAGSNPSRWINADYDAAYDQLGAATTIEAANELLIKMNDLVIEHVVVIPEVNRPADQYAFNNKIEKENIKLGAFEYNFWNIANWNLVR